MARRQRRMCMRDSTRQLCVWSPGSLSEEPADKVISYSGRRLFPTIAEVLRYSADERVRLGGWLDAEAIETSKRGSIADTYADKKLDTSLMLCPLYTAPSPRHRTRSRMPAPA